MGCNLCRGKPAARMSYPLGEYQYLLISSHVFSIMSIVRCLNNNVHVTFWNCCSASESDKGGHVDYVAYFSSLGPTYDKRIKPDIVAPGAGLMSAKASKQNSNVKSCDTTFKQGTSMASPAAAGAAVMLRQYFQDRERKFWTKTCHPSSDMFCKPFTPSGMLLKALLIHSGEPMSRYHGDKQNVDLSAKKGKPDVFQGYGRVQLSNVLPLPGKTDFQLTVRDMVELTEKSSLTHVFEVTDSSQPLVLSLSWFDPPAVSGAAKALVNDLDLMLRLPNGKGEMLGNLNSGRDTVNNNERIVIKQPSRGTYKAIVKAQALPVGGRQRFAFVLTYAGSPANVNDLVENQEQQQVLNEALQGAEAPGAKGLTSQVKMIINEVLGKIHRFFAPNEDK